jgi:hypothetical protein
MGDPTIYTLLRNINTNTHECVMGNVYCMRNSLGEPVHTCSLNRNKNKPMCQNMEQLNSAYRILGCYDSPDCGGKLEIQTFAPCQQEICKDPKPDQCVELRYGSQPADEDPTKSYCYLGESMYDPDPCGLSILHGGTDFCPQSCFHAGCCPGNTRF